jgi:hypothetical protein
VVLSLGISSLVLPNSDVIVALTFGVVLLSNMVQGLTISPVLKRLNLSLSVNTSKVEAPKPETPPTSRGRYSTVLYEPDKPSFEKLFFSSPEYFIMETRFGGWIANRLRHLLEMMNRYLMERLPKNPGGLLKEFMEVLIDIISNFLNWFNIHLTRYEIHHKDKEGSNQN